MSSTAPAQRHFTNDFTTMPSLLERNGFRVHGRRANCIYCEGNSRLTVSFNDEVAYCHRCHWTANVRTLSRKMGISVAPETPEHREARRLAKQFADWVDRCERAVVDRHRFLWRRAGLAIIALRYFPDMEQAWDALADYDHIEAKLCAALDTLRFERASKWLEYAMTPERLFRSWLEEHGHAPR
jgi:hypothetical protein